MIPAPRFPVLVFLLLGTPMACGGDLEGANTDEPPPVATRFSLRIDGRPVELETPFGARYTTDGTTPSYISINARQDPGGGDAIRSAGLLLTEPVKTGVFDCTPNERGEVIGKPASFNPGSFFGFTPTFTDCVVTVTYASQDRVVGTFKVNAHAPTGSSLSGTVATAEGEYDVPVRASKL